jgi:hypothetical protein
MLGIENNLELQSLKLTKQTALRPVSQRIPRLLHGALSGNLVTAESWVALALAASVAPVAPHAARTKVPVERCRTVAFADTSAVRGNDGSRLLESWMLERIEHEDTPF